MGDGCGPLEGGTPGGSEAVLEGRIFSRMGILLFACPVFEKGNLVFEREKEAVLLY
jgi:hypothetical protein